MEVVEQKEISAYNYRSPKKGLYAQNSWAIFPRRREQHAAHARPLGVLKCLQ